MIRHPSGSMAAITEDAWFNAVSPRHSQRIDAAVASPAFRATPPRTRDYLEIARAYAFVGRADRARAMLSRFEAEVKDTAYKREEAPRVHGVLGEIALAERRPMDAVAEFRREDVAADGPSSGCLYCLSAMLARAYDGAGNADSTIAAIERYLAITPGARIEGASGIRTVNRTTGDFFFLAPFEKRLGELYEAKGNGAKALEHFQRFVDLWQYADPELQPKVKEAKTRLARLRVLERSRRTS